MDLSFAVLVGELLTESRHIMVYMYDCVCVYIFVIGYGKSVLFILFN